MQPFGITASGEKTRVLARLDHHSRDHASDSVAVAFIGLIRTEVDRAPDNAHVAVSFNINVAWAVPSAPREVGI